MHKTPHISKVTKRQVEMSEKEKENYEKLASHFAKDLTNKEKNELKKKNPEQLLACYNRSNRRQERSFIYNQAIDMIENKHVLGIIKKQEKETEKDFFELFEMCGSYNDELFYTSLPATAYQIVDTLTKREREVLLAFRELTCQGKIEKEITTHFEEVLEYLKKKYAWPDRKATLSSVMSSLKQKGYIRKKRKAVRKMGKKIKKLSPKEMHKGSGRPYSPLRLNYENLEKDFKMYRQYLFNIMERVHKTIDTF